MLFPSNKNLNLYSGDSHRFIIKWLTGDCEETFPVKLTPNSGLVVMTISKKVEDGPVLTLQGSIENLTTGQIVLPITVAQSRSLEVPPYRKQTYTYSIQWIPAPDQPITLVYGNLVVGSDVTIN